MIKLIRTGNFSAWGLCLLLAFGMISCAEKSIEDGELVDPIRMSGVGISSEGPYFTMDHEGFPVLVWSEEVEPAESGFIVKFARISRDGRKITTTGEVTPSRGCSTTSESMNKIAFRKDGTMVSVYARREPTEENRFAGALYYSQSFDEGKSWTAEKYLHVGDTTSGLSRSFFDLATLPDGEVGAVWLDSRMKDNRNDGSTLFFAKTKEQAGFISDRVIDTGTCECCRTDVYVAKNGDIHVLYRAIWQDSIRDISHVISQDLGETFSEPVRISPDNWVIYGCPHTGPSMTETPEGLTISWFTMGGIPGLYQTSFDPESRFYEQKSLLSTAGRHPQTIMAGQSVVHLWEEGEEPAVELHHASGQGSSPSLSLRDFSAPVSVVKAQVWMVSPFGSIGFLLGENFQLYPWEFHWKMGGLELPGWGSWRMEPKR